MKRGRRYLFPPSGSHAFFRCRILPSKTCSAYSHTASNSLFCHAPKMNYCTVPRHFTHKLSIPIRKPDWDCGRRYGGCLGLGGGRHGNRWWYGRVIKTLDICFNELATQRIKYCNSESQSSQAVIAVLFTGCVCSW